MSEQVPDYTYDALQGSDIRLLTILPGTHGDDIFIDITHVPLVARETANTSLWTLEELRDSLPRGWRAYETVGDRVIFEGPSGVVTWKHPVEGFETSHYIKPTELWDNFEPKYEALSYEWGSPRDTETVYVNGPAVTKLTVRCNLASALRFLRYADRVRTLWIDAVCINQSDIAERGAQIPRMTNIYQLAQRVLAWLGPPAQNSHHALETLQNLGKQSITTLGGWYQMPSPDAMVPGLTHRTVLRYARETWTAISHLLQRPWFERLWVIQEIQLAKNALVVCGLATVTWSAFWEGVAFLYFHQRQSVVRHLHPQRLYPILALGISYRHRSVSTTLFRLVTDRKCTDPRDAVFGLLGMLPEGFRLKMKPRYDVPVEQVYTDAVLAHIQHVQRLELLIPCRLHPNDRRSSPSWVPNFSVMDPPPPQFFEQFASGYSRSWTSYAWDARLTRHVLRVAGVRCATITKVHPRFPSDHDIPAMLSMARALEPDDTTALTTYPTGEPLDVAHAKTMIGNNLKETAPKFKRSTLGEWRRVWKDALTGVPVEKSQDYEGSDAGDTETPIVEVVWQALHYLWDHSYVETREGYVGMTYRHAKPGDVICVLLGLDMPVVLRPHPANPTLFAFVAGAFVYGLHNAIAILGPLPSPWTVQMFDNPRAEAKVFRYFNAETMELSDEDPRLEELDPKWERVSTEPRTGDDPTTFQRFVNRETGEMITHDPRLDRDALIARGTDITTFTLY
ncbi:heterokaryon incompatibility protein-domain-containing protein [Cercophora newfieldiana]|uniref:Heterokaryon incompatibility protein-domain-containing protein n=1 Tax=Cercophora newfieldiana TaxID=92897 RepID=A0AA39YCE4_9PEZI|nr:heterokaryon incompatibility protein-domain-containing protein [Cercophora newfieldiana]